MEDNALLPFLLVVPLSLAAGYVAGALNARRTRREMDEIKTMVASLAKSAAEAPAPAAPAPAPVAAPVPAPAPVAAPAPAPVPVAAPAPAPEPVSDEPTPEILMVISAAVAAFLGKKARVRGARLLRPGAASSAWAQQGRVFVQASHTLPVRGR